MNKRLFFLFSPLVSLFLTQCSQEVSPLEEYKALGERNAEIASEPTGNFFYGRRYYVPFTRFWGYLRQPRQRWSQARLVMIDESELKTPDRLPETDSSRKSYKKEHGFDNNFEYVFYGQYTGKTAYEPNTNQILPVFKLKKWDLVSEEKGFLFTPKEKYNKEAVTLVPSLIPFSQR